MRCANCGHKIIRKNGRWYHIHRYLTYNSDSGEHDEWRYKLNAVCYEQNTTKNIYSSKYMTECDCRKPMPKKRRK